MLIKVSRKNMLQKFQLCVPEYITSVCKGRCCQGTGKIKVGIDNSEVDKIAAKGATVKNNYIEADSRGLCPFKGDNGLCKIHADKPFGCAASPFILTSKDTLIVRNRYRLLKCYNTPNSVPAYLAHRGALLHLFGEVGYETIVKHMENGKEDFFIAIDMGKYLMLKATAIRNAKQSNKLALLEKAKLSIAAYQGVL